MRYNNVWLKAISKNYKKTEDFYNVCKSCD